MKRFIAGAIFCSIFSVNLLASEAATREIVVVSEQNKAVKKDSKLEKFKNETLILGQGCCFLDFHGNDPWFKKVKPDLDDAYSIKLGCIDQETGNPRKIKETQDLENITVLRYMYEGFGSHVATDIKYPGERSGFNKALESILFMDHSYNGIPLVDEYKEGMPMFWILKNAEELRAISTFILKKFEEKQFVPEKKILLVIKLLEDPELKTLNTVDKEFLDTYFVTCPLSDKDVKEFFEKNHDILREGWHRNSSTHPKSVGEDARVGILKDIEKFFKDFDTTRIITVAGAFILTKFIYDEINDLIDMGREKTFGKNNIRKSWSGSLINKLTSKSEA
jgi:hypothetical protein